MFREMLAAGPLAHLRNEGFRVQSDPLSAKSPTASSHHGGKEGSGRRVLRLSRRGAGGAGRSKSSRLVSAAESELPFLPRKV